jgi:carbonic anhydrase/acetyltransferase-like protein (isoleucine patch superfamily)
MIIKFQDKCPKVSPTAFIAENACVIGDVEIGPGTNIWFNSIIRGDLNYVRIGANCNIQDACILHVDRELYPVIIEDEVILGHRVVAHGCRIGKGALIAIGAIVLNGAEIGEKSIVGAGSVVTPNSSIPPGTLALGTPAKPIRPLGEKDFQMIRDTLSDYENLKKIYSDMKWGS